MTATRTSTRSWRLTVGLLVVVGLALSLLLAFFVSPLSSSSPDGLQKVAADTAIDRGERHHALADGPLADYSVRGVRNGRLSTGLAGAVGVAVTFAIGGAVFVVLRRSPARDRGRARSSSPSSPSSPSTPSTVGGAGP